MEFSARCRGGSCRWSGSIGAAKPPLSVFLKTRRPAERHDGAFIKAREPKELRRQVNVRDKAGTRA